MSKTSSLTKLSMVMHRPSLKSSKCCVIPIASTISQSPGLPAVTLSQSGLSGRAFSCQAPPLLRNPPQASVRGADTFSFLRLSLGLIHSSWFVTFI